MNYELPKINQTFFTDICAMTTQELSGKQITIMAITAGICAANIYFNQPILGKIAASLNTSESAAGIVAVMAQAGYGLGLFFLTPLGDKIDR